MNIQEVIASGVIELYVLGIANESEIALVEICIANNPTETLAEIAAIENALAEKALGYSKTPPDYLENKIATKLFGEEEVVTNLNNQKKVEQNNIIIKEGNVIPFSKNYKYAIAASIALLVGSIIANMVMYQKYKSSANEIVAVQNKLNEEIAYNKSLNTQLEIPSNKNAKFITLQGTEKHTEALAKIYWITNTGEVYVDAANLPKAPQGKQYQFWAIVDGQPIDGGMIIDNGKVKIQQLKTFGKAQAFAITLEKEGGVEKPTMDQMFVMAKT